MRNSSDNYANIGRIDRALDVIKVLTELGCAMQHDRIDVTALEDECRYDKLLVVVTLYGSIAA